MLQLIISDRRFTPRMFEKQIKVENINWTIQYSCLGFTYTIIYTLVVKLNYPKNWIF